MRMYSLKSIVGLERSGIKATLHSEWRPSLILPSQLLSLFSWWSLFSLTISYMVIFVLIHQILYDMLSIVTFLVISIRLVATQKVRENRKEWCGAKLAQNSFLLLLEWYLEDQDCVNMLQGSSISSNPWHYMGRAFPNWPKYSRIRASRPLFHQSYCSHLSHYSYLLYTHTLFVLQYFILFGYFGCPSSSISTLPSLHLNI